MNSDIMAEAEKLLALCAERDITIATAESCTGGLIAAALTAIPGASRYVVAGLVCYANSAKMRLLSVERDLLRREGAVSAACARSMARGALAATGAKLALSSTGIAGPGGGTAERPVGLVHIAAAMPDKINDITCQFGSLSRQEIREKSVMAALRLAAELVQ